MRGVWVLSVGQASAHGLVAGAGTARAGLQLKVEPRAGGAGAVCAGAIIAAVVVATGGAGRGVGERVPGCALTTHAGVAARGHAGAGRLAKRSPLGATVAASCGSARALHVLAARAVVVRVQPVPVALYRSAGSGWKLQQFS